MIQIQNRAVYVNLFPLFLPGGPLFFESEPTQLEQEYPPYEEDNSYDVERLHYGMHENVARQMVYQIHAPFRNFRDGIPMPHFIVDPLALLEISFDLVQIRLDMHPVSAVDFSRTLNWFIPVS